MSEEELTTRERVTQQLIDAATRELDVCTRGSMRAQDSLIVHRVCAKEIPLVQALPGYVLDDDDRLNDRLIRRRIDEAEQEIAWFSEMGDAWAEILALLMTRHRTEIAT